MATLTKPATRGLCAPSAPVTPSVIAPPPTTGDALTKFPPTYSVFPDTAVADTAAYGVTPQRFWSTS